MTYKLLLGHTAMRGIICGLLLLLSVCLLVTTVSPAEMAELIKTLLVLWTVWTYGRMKFEHL